VISLSLLFFAAACFTNNVADNDLWGKLRHGQDLLRNGIARVDPYSYTVPGRPWVEHEWGAEAIFALLYHAFGAPGLIVTKMALGTAALALVLRLAWETSRNMTAVAIVFVPVVFGVFPWFGVRGQIFTHALFALTLYILHRYREGHRRMVWTLPPLMMLWANLHGGFVAGLGIVGFATVVEGVESWWRRTAPSPVLPAALLAVLVCCVLATTVSPYGPSYPLTVLPWTLMARPGIAEWGPLSRASMRDVTLMTVPLLLGLATAALATPRARRDTLQVALLALTAAAAVRHVRHTPFFLFTCLWVLPQYLAGWRVPRRTFATTVVVASLATARLVLAVGTLDHLVVRADAFPIGAVRFMDEHGITGNVAVSFNWGSYLIGKCYPRCRVSIDGRFEETYPPDVRAMSDALAGGEAGWERLLTEYPTDVVLLHARGPGAARVASAAGWTLVYRDAVAALFVRDVPRFRAVTTRYGDAPATGALEDGVFP